MLTTVQSDAQAECVAGGQMRDAHTADAAQELQSCARHMGSVGAPVLLRQPRHDHVRVTDRLDLGTV